MSVIALIFVPIVLAYQGWTYYMFRQRISTDEASTGEPVTAVVREFLHWLGGRRLLGYNLGFDLDMLGPHVRALTLVNLDGHCWLVVFSR